MTTKPDMLLWLSDARGKYIPRDFASSFKDRAASVKGVSQEDWDVLDKGPDHEFYWETWEDVLNNARITDENGVEYRVEQNGDCWLVPVGMEWDDAAETYAWPDESE